MQPAFSIPQSEIVVKSGQWLREASRTIIFTIPLHYPVLLSTSL